MLITPPVRETVHGGGRIVGGRLISHVQHVELSTLTWHNGGADVDEAKGTCSSGGSGEDKVFGLSGEGKGCRHNRAVGERRPGFSRRLAPQGLPASIKQAGRSDAGGTSLVHPRVACPAGIRGISRATSAAP